MNLAVAERSRAERLAVALELETHADRPRLVSAVEALHDQVERLRSALEGGLERRPNRDDVQTGRTGSAPELTAAARELLARLETLDAAATARGWCPACARFLSDEDATACAAHPDAELTLGPVGADVAQAVEARLRPAPVVRRLDPTRAGGLAGWMRWLARRQGGAQGDLNVTHLRADWPVFQADLIRALEAVLALATRLVPPAGDAAAAWVSALTAGFDYYDRPEEFAEYEDGAHDLERARRQPANHAPWMQLRVLRALLALPSGALAAAGGVVVLPRLLAGLPAEGEDPARWTLTPALLQRVTGFVDVQEIVKATPLDPPVDAAARKVAEAQLDLQRVMLERGACFGGADGLLNDRDLALTLLGELPFEHAPDPAVRRCVSACLARAFASRFTGEVGRGVWNGVATSTRRVVSSQGAELALRALLDRCQRSLLAGSPAGQVEAIARLFPSAAAPPPAVTTPAALRAHVAAFFADHRARDAAPAFLLALEGVLPPRTLFGDARPGDDWYAPLPSKPVAAVHGLLRRRVGVWLADLYARRLLHAALGRFRLADGKSTYHPRDGKPPGWAGDLETLRALTPDWKAAWSADLAAHYRLAVDRHASALARSPHPDDRFVGYLVLGFARSPRTLATFVAGRAAVGVDGRPDARVRGVVADTLLNNLLAGTTTAAGRKNSTSVPFHSLDGPAAELEHDPHFTVPGRRHLSPPRTLALGQVRASLVGLLRAPFASPGGESGRYEMQALALRYVKRMGVPPQVGEEALVLFALRQADPELHDWAAGRLAPALVRQVADAPGRAPACDVRERALEDPYAALPVDRATVEAAGPASLAWWLVDGARRADLERALGERVAAYYAAREGLRERDFRYRPAPDAPRPDALDQSIWITLCLLVHVARQRALPTLGELLRARRRDGPTAEDRKLCAGLLSDLAPASAFVLEAVAPLAPTDDPEVLQEVARLLDNEAVEARKTADASAAYAALRRAHAAAGGAVAERLDALATRFAANAHLDEDVEQLHQLLDEEGAVSPGRLLEQLPRVSGDAIEAALVDADRGAARRARLVAGLSAWPAGDRDAQQAAREALRALLSLAAEPAEGAGAAFPYAPRRPALMDVAGAVLAASPADGDLPRALADAMRAEAKARGGARGESLRQLVAMTLTNLLLRGGPEERARQGAAATALEAVAIDARVVGRGLGRLAREAVGAHYAALPPDDPRIARLVQRTRALFDRELAPPTERWSADDDPRRRHLLPQDASCDPAALLTARTLARHASAEARCGRHISLLTRVGTDECRAAAAELRARQLLLLHDLWDCAGIELVGRILASVHHVSHHFVARGVQLGKVRLTARGRKKFEHQGEVSRSACAVFMVQGAAIVEALADLLGDREVQLSLLDLEAEGVERLADLLEAIQRYEGQRAMLLGLFAAEGVPAGPCPPLTSWCALRSEVGHDLAREDGRRHPAFVLIARGPAAIAAPPALKPSTLLGLFRQARDGWEVVATAPDLLLATARLTVVGSALLGVALGRFDPTVWEGMRRAAGEALADLERLRDHVKDRPIVQDVGLCISTVSTLLAALDCYRAWADDGVSANERALVTARSGLSFVEFMMDAGGQKKIEEFVTRHASRKAAEATASKGSQEAGKRAGQAVGNVVGFLVSAVSFELALSDAMEAADELGTCPAWESHGFMQVGGVPFNGKVLRRSMEGLGHGSQAVGYGLCACVAGAPVGVVLIALGKVFATAAQVWELGDLIFGPNDYETRAKWLGYEYC
ncbi:MAG: hypothetical protein M9894_31220 [Planctomycetes bacterium]|nr:hypothetical protein [Planctomycetota bacterium]